MKFTKILLMVLPFIYSIIKFYAPDFPLTESVFIELILYCISAFTSGVAYKRYSVLKYIKNETAYNPSVGYLKHSI